MSTTGMVQDYGLKIEFEFQRGIECEDVSERLKFWTSPRTIQWFQDHGYTLYEHFIDDESGDIEETSFPAILPITERTEEEYPYASYYARQVTSNEGIPLGAIVRQGKVVYAQDSMKRHVAIKIVRTNTDEYEIMKFLKQQDLESLRKGYVLPILDLLHIEGFCFAVMPRWGGALAYPVLTKRYEILDMVHGMLKGLAFLHQHNIVHGDLRLDNFLIDDFCGDLERKIMRQERRLQRRSSYAIFDFDWSIKVPVEIDRNDYRLPYYRCWGSFNITTDTAQGEFDYNPFVMDVGALGVLLCEQFQHRTGDLPLLAPLLDSMTNRDLAKRPTSAQALKLFEELSSQLSEDELDYYISMPNSRNKHTYEGCDRWAAVPREFVEKWGHLKQPPIHWSTKLLRRAADTRWGIHNIPRIRWFFFQISLLPRRLFGLFGWRR